MIRLNLFCRKTLFLSLILIGFVILSIEWHASASVAEAAPASENYVLDSLIIGVHGSTNASSSNFSTGEHPGSVLIYEGSIATSSTSTDTGGSGSGGGGGGRLQRQPSSSDDETGAYPHIICRNAPLTLRVPQSGTCTHDFLYPAGSVTLNIPRYSFHAHTEPHNSTTSATFTLSRSPIPEALQPKNTDANLIFEDTVIVLSAEHAHDEPLTTLTQYLTLTLEYKEYTKDEYLAVYYLHEDHDAWILLERAIIAEDGIIFQTPYITSFLVMKGRIEDEHEVRTGTTENQEPERVILTPRSTEEDKDIIYTDAQESEARIQTEIAEREASVSRESFFEYLIHSIKEVPASLKTIPPQPIFLSFLILLILFLLYIHRRT